MAQMLFDVHDVVVLGQWWKKLHGVSRPRTERFLLSVLSSEKAGRKERLCLFLLIQSVKLLSLLCYILPLSF